MCAEGQGKPLERHALSLSCRGYMPGGYVYGALLLFILIPRIANNTHLIHPDFYATFSV